MPRSRVLSFMSTWGGPRSPTSETPLSEKATPSPSAEQRRKSPPGDIDISTAQRSTSRLNASAPDSPGSPTAASRARGDTKVNRMSMLQAYNPPQVEVANDTPPELQPIFTFLNSHSNKLYQEGYFLKLHDLDSRGRPSADRVWTECFAQLIGTVLSLWDAAALDVAGEDAEVVPTFINLSDANIKMIESLPMNGAQGGNLQNVLSISTAANNRYLLHFNTLNSLTQWTAGIRLAMFEHSTLQEAYTGSLIAGKGKNLNNIKQIMYRLQFAHEDWARVRFGAGTPWQRCWCVISPPDEKEWNKAQKAVKKGSYEKAKMPKGEIKFYDTRKVTKKTRPMATLTDAYAAYAIYPQSKPLIEQSTLVKVEGVVTIHGSQDSTTEGFVFVMPEVHQAVTGFEMMLRWLFPCFDTFGLYGRPAKLVADTLDQRGLMFAMPNSRRYGYLDTLDVSGLIHTKGSHSWTERQWRREMKKLTADRMMNYVEGSPRNSQQETRRRNTENLRPGVRFGEGDLARSTPGSRTGSPAQLNGGGDPSPLPRTDSAPPDASRELHKRAVSEAYGAKTRPSQPSQDMSEDGPLLAPAPPEHRDTPANGSGGRRFAPGALERIQSGAEVPTQATFNDTQELPPPMPYAAPPAPPEPVGPPPAFTHAPNSRPSTAPYAPPELRRANSNVDAATLYQMQEATRPQEPMPELDLQWQVQNRQQNTVALQSASSNLGVSADRSQGAVNRMQRDPRQRLSTIPGSPFIGDQTESPEPSSLQQFDGAKDTPPPPLLTREISQPDRPAPPVPLHSSHSIARKPVPKVPTSEITNGKIRPQADAQTAGPPPAPTSVPPNPPVRQSTIDNSFEDDWEGAIIDAAALERQLNAVERTSTNQSSNTESSEPDYASTIASSTGKKSIEKPRAGKMKTVGDPTLMPTISSQAEDSEPEQTPSQPIIGSSDILGVDFGPTYSMRPTIGSRSGSSATMRPEDVAERRRSRSADRIMELSRESAGGASLPNNPNESARLSYFNSATARAGGSTTPDSGKRSSVVWQPGMAPGGMHQSQTSLTPEEWVQQRAAMAQSPQYALPKKTTPERYESVQTRRKLTKTPPLSRNLSGDYTQARQAPARPSSRGAGVNLDAAGASVSALEQMQISRATGSPLISLPTNANKPQEPQSGLIGAVVQRERDRVTSKEGRNSMFVQQAIESQQRQMRMEAEAQAQQQYELQMQQQAQQQAQQQVYDQHRRMQQQQMNWNQQAYMQSPQYTPQQMQQRPAMQYGDSWQQAQQQQQMGYNAASGTSQYGGVYAPQGRPPPPYGASFTGQQQQQYGRR